MNAYIFVGLNGASQAKVRKEIKFVDAQTRTTELESIKFVVKMNIQEIFAAVEQCTNIGIEKLKGLTRKREAVTARYMAIHLVRINLNMNLKQIGKLFNRDHSTVIYALATHNILFKQDLEYRVAYNKVLEML